MAVQLDLTLFWLTPSFQPHTMPPPYRLDVVVFAQRFSTTSGLIQDSVSGYSLLAHLGDLGILGDIVEGSRHGCCLLSNKTSHTGLATNT